MRSQEGLFRFLNYFYRMAAHKLTRRNTFIFRNMKLEFMKAFAKNIFEKVRMSMEFEVDDLDARKSFSFLYFLYYILHILLLSFTQWALSSMPLSYFFE